jgi:hypothetical protein
MHAGTDVCAATLSRAPRCWSRDGEPAVLCAAGNSAASAQPGAIFLSVLWTFSHCASRLVLAVVEAEGIQDNLAVMAFIGPD